MERSPLRLVPPGAAIANPPFRGALDAALRLAGSERGAIVHRAGTGSSVIVTGANLSPEEEAACRSLARRVWQHPPRGGTLASSLGGSTLLAQPIDSDHGDGAFVVAMPGGGGKIDAGRLAVLRDVATMLAPSLGGELAALQALADVEEERRRAGRVLALNRALEALADTDDVGVACTNLLAELVPRFPGVDMASVWLLQADGSNLRRVACQGLPEGAPESDRVLPVGAGHDFDRAIDSGEMTVLEFGRGTARGRSTRLARQLGLATVLQVPLRSRNSVTGLLMLGSRAAREFTADERLFLETLGVQLGGHLDAIRQLEAAEAERKRLQALIETLPVGIVIFDADGRVTLHNRAIEEIWGEQPADAAAGRPEMGGLLNAEGRPLAANDTPLARALRGDGSQHGQELIVRQPRSGREVPVLVNAAPIYDGQGRMSGAVTVYQDITQVREIDFLKDQFINSVSHELRTPTTTVRGGALTLLKRGDQLEEPVKRQLLRDMADEGERLYHLVEDLLSLSRAQAGMKVNPEPIIVRRFVNKVILDLGGRVGNHTLTVELQPNLPLIEADPERLEQVLRNLIENAVKFSPKGRRIEITAKASEREVMFSVLDRGSGIPPEDMDRVFEPFYKTAEAVRTSSQGAGLGLTVSRKLIEIQGGRIWAEARTGGGTVFRFTLPVLQEDFDS